MEIMYLKEKFSGYNNKELSMIDSNISDIVKMERDCLVKIFECRDNIDYQIGCLSVREKNSDIQKELLDNLVDSRRILFKKFFINYCKSKNLLKYNNNYSDDLEKYFEIDDFVRHDISIRVFREVKKDDILKLFDKPLEYDGIYRIIDDFVSNFVNNIDQYLLHFLPDGSEQHSSNDFVGYFENVLSKIIKLKIGEEKLDLNLDGLFDLISQVTCACVEKKSVDQICSEFLNNGSCVSLKTESYENLDDDSDIIFSGVDQLLKCTYVKDFDVLIKYDISSINKHEISCDIRNFVNGYLDFGDKFDDLDDDDFLKKVSGIPLDDKSYEIWKKIFIKRIKFPAQTGDLKLKNVKDSDNIMKFISLMREKYPKAKNYIGNIGAHNFKDMKVDFLRLYVDKLLNKVFDVLDSGSFKKCTLGQLYRVMYVYLGTLGLNKLDLSADFEEYIKQYLEQCFVESHKSVIDKQEAKASRQEQSQEVKELEKVETVEEQKVEQVQKKEGLSKDLLEDIDFYFTHVDLKFSDEEKSSIIKVLEKLPGKYYKRSWFKDFELNDIFFQNLDKNGYICEDEVVDEDSSQSNGSTNSTENVEENGSRGNILLSNSLLLGFDKIEDIGLKIDKYFEVLKLLGYSFHKKEQKIKDKILELSKSNASFFTSFSSVIVNLVNGAQILEKKEKRWQNMPVYCLDIGGTGYRLVCLSKGDGEKKAIFDIMSHGAYITFLNKKCN